MLMKAVRKIHPSLPVAGDQVTPCKVWDVYHRYLTMTTKEEKNQEIAVCREDFDFYCKLESASKLTLLSSLMKLSK